jgi:hypothetical protein
MASKLSQTKAQSLFGHGSFSIALSSGRRAANAAGRWCAYYQHATLLVPACAVAGKHRDRGLCDPRAGFCQMQVRSLGVGGWRYHRGTNAAHRADGAEQIGVHAGSRTIISRAWTGAQIYAWLPFWPGLACLHMRVQLFRRRHKRSSFSQRVIQARMLVYRSTGVWRNLQACAHLGDKSAVFG